MLHTKQKICKVKTTLDGNNIKYVTQQKYLGLIIDGPKLSWKPHIEYLSSRCTGKVNLMKGISGQQWGADRTMLSRIYTALIRSRIDYGSIFYDSASTTSLKHIDKIQNICLRIITGARRSSPITSLEVESNFPPLRYHREKLKLKYYCRLAELPDSTPVVEELFTKYPRMLTYHWSKLRGTEPLIVNIRNLLKIYKFPHSYKNTFSLSNIINTSLARHYKLG